MTLRKLMIVSHSATGHVAHLVDAVLDGASKIEGVEAVRCDALTACAQDVFDADMVVLATPANFGYMSGALKHFFDNVYDDCLDRTRGRPYTLVVKGDSDTQGAVDSVNRIVSSLSWRAAQPPLTVTGALTSDHLAAGEELGATLAGGLALGVW